VTGVQTCALPISQEREISKAGREAYGQRISILRKKLLADGFSEKRSKRLASLCTSALQGALIQARIDRSGEALIIAAEELADMLDGLKQQSQLRHSRSFENGKA